MVSGSRPPIHESLHVVNSEDIYQNEDWWKSAVRYRVNQDEEHDEVAVYMWHNDDGWTRKNKYVIKTPEAWEADKTIINQLFSDSSITASVEDFPVSDYYEIAAGETVFQSDGWWKAILKISKKGSYETEEVMVYLWQEVDGDWRRRQKFTIKSEERWRKEVDVIESIVDTTATRDTDHLENGASSTDDVSEDDSYTQPDEFKRLSRELEKHLSEDTSR
jgi:hypothetical protein